MADDFWTCAKCGEQIEPDFDVCWSCTTPRDGLPEAAPDPSTEGIITARDFEAERRVPSDASLVQVASFSYPQDAHLLKARLEAEGIPASIADEHSVMTNWLMQGAIGGVKVLVLENDVARAKVIVARSHLET